MLILANQRKQGWEYLHEGPHSPGNLVLVFPIQWKSAFNASWGSIFLSDGKKGRTLCKQGFESQKAEV